MSLFKFILYFIVGYFLYVLFKKLMRLFQPSETASFKRNEQRKNSTIDKGDIIEADFEEIEAKHNENSKN